jgi:hypothetical protein
MAAAAAAPASSSCTPDILAKFSAAAPADYLSWLSTQETQLNTLAATTAPGPTVAQGITQIIGSISAHQACLQDQLNSVSAAATATATTQTSLSDRDQAIQERQRDVQIAKDRMLLARFPERNRSYYDSWFPLFRPLKAITVPILLGISIFFLMMALFILVSLLKLDVRILRFALPAAPTQPYYTPWWKRGFLGMTMVAIVLLGLTIYAFRR